MASTEFLALEQGLEREREEKKAAGEGPAEAPEG